MHLSYVNQINQKVYLEYIIVTYGRCWIMCSIFVLNIIIYNFLNCNYLLNFMFLYIHDHKKLNTIRNLIGNEGKVKRLYFFQICK